MNYWLFVSLSFFAVSVLHAAAASASYHEGFKASSWFIPFGVFTSGLANFVWYMVLKKTQGPQNIYLMGVIWDVVITVVYLLIPIAFFNLTFSPKQAVGIVLALTGIYMIKG